MNFIYIAILEQWKFLMFWIKKYINNNNNNGINSTNTPVFTYSVVFCKIHYYWNILYINKCMCARFLYVGRCYVYRKCAALSVRVCVCCVLYIVYSPCQARSVSFTLCTLIMYFAVYVCNFHKIANSILVTFYCCCWWCCRCCGGRCCCRQCVHISCVSECALSLPLLLLSWMAY